MSLLDRETTATSAKEEPLRLTKDLKTVTVRVATVIRLSRGLQHGLAPKLQVTLRADELLLLIIVDGLIELGHEPFVLQCLRGNGAEVSEMHILDAIDTLLPSLFTSQILSV